MNGWKRSQPQKLRGSAAIMEMLKTLLGHLLFAKQIIANVLVDKVKDGYFSEAEAKNIARMLLYDNAVNIYKLSKSDRLFPEQIYYKVP